MTAFVWTDSDGQEQKLDNPTRIEAEATAVATELDRYIDILEGPERALRDTARAAINSIQPRLKQLRSDLARWNDHALAVTRAEATKLAEQIDRLPAAIADALLVVELHGEHSRLLAITTDAPDMRARRLAEPMTAHQRQAITAWASRTAPADTATRGEAKTWLDAQPRFARGGPVDGGWFGWVDRKGYAHRLTDPLAIEREVASIAKELAGLRPALTDPGTIEALYDAVNAGVASWERLQILQGDLERFDREATAREETAWTAYAADWRSKRKTS